MQLIKITTSAFLVRIDNATYYNSNGKCVIDLDATNQWAHDDKFSSDGFKASRIGTSLRICQGAKS